MNLFLQGRSGVGKSTLLSEVLASYASMIAGFCVQRLIENGERIAFRAARFQDGYPALEAEYTDSMEGVFILRGQQYIRVLEESILRAEEASREPGRKLVLLDEIGGVELASPAVFCALKRLLLGKTPCAGVFKSEENYMRMTRNLGLAEDRLSKYNELKSIIEATGRLIDVTEHNREVIRGELVVNLIPLLCRQD